MTRRVCLLLAATHLAGCVTNDPLSVVTYNAGLAVGFVPGANERAPGTAAALVELEAEVACLQEVWLPEHIEIFEDAAADSYTDTFFPAPQPDEPAEPACTNEEIDPLITCMETYCGDSCIDELPACLLASCGLTFLTLDRSCMECAQANVGNPLEEIESTCTTVSTKYSYGGAFGLRDRDPEPTSHRPDRGAGPREHDEQTLGAARCGGCAPGRYRRLLHPPHRGLPAPTSPRSSRSSPTRG
jgi:hypothetical protein